jgi:hypothetical protein
MATMQPARATQFVRTGTTDENTEATPDVEQTFTALSDMQHFLGVQCPLVRMGDHVKVCKHWRDNYPLQIIVERGHGYVNISDFIHCTHAFYPIQSRRAFLEWFQTDGLTLIDIHGGADGFPIVASPSCENVVDFWLSPILFKHYIYNQGRKPWLVLVDDVIHSVLDHRHVSLPSASCPAGR